MMGGVAAALSSGRDLRSALVQGAAAGAANFLRHGLGTGSREAVAELAEHVELRPAGDQNGGSTAAPETIAEGPSRAIQPS
jgi:1-phosphofructokinase